jgi:hypothetical protein
MKFPIPDGKAEVAAKDFAADCRATTRQYLRLKEAYDNGESLSKTEYADMEMLYAQITSFCETSFIDVETGAEFFVKDYVTRKRADYAARIKDAIQVGYQRFLHALQS